MRSIRRGLLVSAAVPALASWSLFFRRMQMFPTQRRLRRASERGNKSIQC